MAALTSGALAASACEAEGVDDSVDRAAEEEFGEAAAEIQGGDVDVEFSAAFPGTVMLETDVGLPPAGGLPGAPDLVRCSGTLVSPHWVLTAAHCIDKTENGIHRSVRDWTVYVSPRGNHESTASNPLTYGLEARTFHHTFKTGLDIIPFHDAPTEPFEIRDTDMALVRLDRPVEPPIGLPAALPRSHGECGAELVGQLVGMSPNGLAEYLCPDEPGGWLRRYSTVGFWNWEEQGVAAVFHRLFFAEPYQACSQLTGIGTGGDSGGSLYRPSGVNNDLLLCGVVSGDGPQNIYGSFSTGVTHRYQTSATDHATNILWLDHLFRDADGFGEGSFESRGTWDDPDGDGIASAHDNCPWTWNPEQLTTYDDPDGDGLGAACDPCSESDGGDLDNLNYEVERAVAETSGLVEPVDPDDFASTSEYEAAQVAWKASFRPDVCDPTPVPLQSLREGGDLPIDFPAPPGSCGLGGGGCSLVVRNEIKIDGRTTTDDIPPGTSATLGFRFCDCQDAPPGTNTESLMGRRKCLTDPNTSCTYSGTAYDSTTNNWKKIVTPKVQQNMTWDDVEEGAEWTHAPGTNIQTFWDFTQLGDAVITTSSSQKVKGVLWATFRNLSSNVPEVPPASLKSFGATLGTGDAGWKYKTNSPRVFHPSRDEAFCRECPMGLRHPFYEVGYPDDWRVAIEGESTSFPAPDATTINHYEQVAQGTVRHVTAAEPLRTLAKLFPMGQSFVRSLGLEGQAVTRVLEADRLDALPARVAWSTPDAGPSTAFERGYTFSATRQRLYVVGGRQLSGAPLNEAWTLDLATGDWRQFPVPGAESVGAVLAASFRWQDSAVYFLDRSGTSLRLRRWNTGRKLTAGVVQTLATFPSAWNAFAKVDLVQTPSGDMLIVAWGGTATTKTMVGLLTMGESSTVAMPGIKSSTLSIAAPPGAGLTGYTSMTAAAPGPAPIDPYATSTTYASMTNPHPTLRPTIHPH